MSVSKLALVSILLLAGFAAAPAQESCSGPTIFTSQSCIGDAVSAKEMELYKAVNAYREANGLASLRLSSPLSRLGNRRMLDLNQNMKTITHSWSNCRYDIKDESTWPCMSASPTRLNIGYTGEGYETLFRTTRNDAEPSAALDAWKKSDLHSSIILNRGMFERFQWDEVGVAIDGPFAALWFGYKRAETIGPTATASLGVSLERTIEGLSAKLSPSPVDTSIGQIWKGVSADNKTVLLLSGSPKSLSLIELAIAGSPNVSGTVGRDEIGVMSRLLKNVLPNWGDADAWLSASMQILVENPKGWRKTTIQDRVVELRGLGSNGIAFVIKPYEKPKAIAMD